MPPYLYYTPPQSPDGVAPVGSEKTTIRIENNTALEMVYRINIGGRQLNSDQDTGMYRNWDGLSYEYNYSDDSSRRFSTLPQNSNIQLNFSTIPEYSALKEVYQTSRSMEVTNDNNNLTWEFPVDSMFSYLVRLHFCELEGGVTMPRQRVFRIYIANQTVEQLADIIDWTGGNGRPVYRDYVVFMSGM
ncbi:hypothetical protein ACFX2A_024248 [Malus domestica]